MGVFCFSAALQISSVKSSPLVINGRFSIGITSIVCTGVFLFFLYEHGTIPRKLKLIDCVVGVAKVCVAGVNLRARLLAENYCV
jgi:hypothetical protein